MKNKKRFLISMLITCILVLTPMYLFVGCNDKENTTQTSSIESAVKENQNANGQEADKNDTNQKEIKSSDTSKESENQQNNSKVSNSNNDNNKVITAEEKNKNVKSESEVSNKKEESKPSSSKFTSKDAIKICENKYGKNSDTIYACGEKMKNVNGTNGYIVQVKSKELMKQGGNGVAFTVLVTPSGQIIEL